MLLEQDKLIVLNSSQMSADSKEALEQSQKVKKEAKTIDSSIAGIEKMIFDDVNTQRIEDEAHTPNGKYSHLFQS